MLPVIDHRQGNSCIRYFTNKRRDRRELRKFVEKEMDHAHIINGLVARLENEELAITRRLIHCLASLLDEFSADLQKEPYSVIYYESLSADILQLLKLLSSEKNPHVVLYNTLNDLLIGSLPTPPNEQNCRKDIPSLLTALKARCDIMYAYNNLITSFIQQESARPGKPRATSRIGQRLFRISHSMVTLIVTTKCTCTRLAEWQKMVQRMEMLAIYD